MLERLPEFPRLPGEAEEALPLTGPPPPAVQKDLYERLEALQAAASPASPALNLKRWASPWSSYLSAPLSDYNRASLEALLAASARQAIEAWERPRDAMIIVESREPMVDLSRVLSDRVSFSERPFEEACGSYAGQRRIFWARTSVAERLEQLTRILSVIEVSFRIEDGFRPLEVQAGLYRRRLALVKREHPDWAESRLRAEAATKTAPTPRRAGHMSGAAVDLTLIDKAGKELPRGNFYPQGGVAVNLAFPYLTWEEFCTRRVFAFSAILCGLTPYPGEDWHVSRGDLLGNILWQDKSACFGPIHSFSASGAVSPMSEAETTEEFQS